MPLFLSIVEFSNVLFINAGIDFVLLKVTSLALLRARWLKIILTPFGA
jgi:hypothetical protein